MDLCWCLALIVLITSGILICGGGLIGVKIKKTSHFKVVQTVVEYLVDQVSLQTESQSDRSLHQEAIANVCLLAPLLTL